MKSHNLCRPLTVLEMLITSEDKRKLLSKLYDTLLNEVLVMYKAKNYWEKDLQVMYMDQQWRKLK